jgi:rRNA-processing protein FCF1
MISKPIKPYAERLRDALAEIEGAFLRILGSSEIVNVNPNSRGSGVVVVGAADWGWAPSDSATTAARMDLLGLYRDWYKRVRLLFEHPTPEVLDRLGDADAFVCRWLERPREFDHSIPQAIGTAREVAQEEFQVFHELIDLASGRGDGSLRLLPDTNALLRNPDLASYSRGVGSDAYVVHIVTTVIRELDELKDRGRSGEVREQAQAVVRRLKGLRDKGSLGEGVNLTKTVVIRTEHREVDARGVLDWLDPDIADDRILAAALVLQSSYPDGTVILVTSDLNLQNKADAVGLPYVETPPNPTTLQANLQPAIEWPRTDYESSVPVALLTNAGPAEARTIQYRVQTTANGGPPHSTAGPWSVDHLKKGEATSHEIYGLFQAEVDIVATWTDDKERSETWTMSIPPRPTQSRWSRRGR